MTDDQETPTEEQPSEEGETPSEPEAGNPLQPMATIQGAEPIAETK